MNKADLRLDWCDYKAAKYAVEHWHYSRRMPMPPLARVGAWESGNYIGCVLFGRGANPSLGKVYELQQTEVCELVRVALRPHVSPVSRIASISVRFLSKSNPGLRLIVSYADPSEGHHGGIYQAMGWLYVGITENDWEYLHEGRWKHSREVRGGAFGSTRKLRDYSGLPRRIALGKYKYLCPLDDETRQRITPLAKPYPKRGTGETDNAAQSNEQTGGASPTVPLLKVG